MKHTNSNVAVLAATLLAMTLIAGAAHAADIQPAIAEFEAMRHAKAEQMFRPLVNDPQHKNLANYYLGRIELGRGKFTEGRELLETSVGIEPNSADELYWLATSCIAMFQRPSENSNTSHFFCYFQYLEQALIADPTHVPTLIYLHQLFTSNKDFAAGDPARAGQLRTQMEIASKADADGSQLLELNVAKDFKQAVTLARSIVTAHPSSARALLEAGKTLANNGHKAEALAAFEKAVAIKVTLANRASIQSAYYEIGNLSWLTKTDLDRGIAALLKAVETNFFAVTTTTNWSYWRLAQLHKMKGDAAGEQKYLALLEKTGVERVAAQVKEMEKK